MTDSLLKERIEALYQSDRRYALIFVVLLWITLLFVLAMSWSHITDATVRIVVLVAGALVLVFNTASIFAMLNHYAEDKEFIYGIDIKYTDAHGELKKGGGK